MCSHIAMLGQYKTKDIFIMGENQVDFSNMTKWNSHRQMTICSWGNVLMFVYIFLQCCYKMLLNMKLYVYEKMSLNIKLLFSGNHLHYSTLVKWERKQCIFFCFSMTFACIFALYSPCKWHFYVQWHFFINIHNDIL